MLIVNEAPAIVVEVTRTDLVIVPDSVVVEIDTTPLQVVIEYGPGARGIDGPTGPASTVPGPPGPPGDDGAPGISGIRYVGDVEPDTTGWAENELWLDTLGD